MQTQTEAVKHFLFLLFLVLMPSTAEAYIGPGLGLGTIGVIIGVLVSSLLILFSIVWLPLKRLIKWLRRPKDSNTEISGKKDL